MQFDLTMRWLWGIFRGIFYLAISLVGLGWIVYQYLYACGVIDGFRHPSGATHDLVLRGHRYVWVPVDPNSLPVYWPFAILFLPTLYLAWRGFRDAWYFHKVHSVFVKEKPQLWEMTIHISESLDNQTIYVELVQTEPIEKGERIKVYKPWGWKPDHGFQEQVQVFSSPKLDHPVVILTSCGLLYSNPHE